MTTITELPEKMYVDATLVRDVAVNVGGGANHGGVQITAAYEFAVARYNHRKCKPGMKAELLEEIRAFEAQLYVMGRRK